MIRTILWSGWLSLKRDRVALALVFVLPIVFFSIFAGIFTNLGGGGSSGMPAVDIVVVDDDRSDASRRLVAALVADESLDVRTAPKDRPDTPYDRDEAEELVTDGDIPVAVVIPVGFGEAFGSFGPDGAVVEILADTVADPVAHQMVAGMLQKAGMTAAPDLMIKRGLAMFEQYGGPMTDEQREAMDHYIPQLAEGSQGGGGGPVSVVLTDVRQPSKEQEKAQRKSRLVAFYAAGIGVMFLLFSMTGAMGALLQEEQTGTLERVLNCNVGMGTLLLGY